MKMRIILLLLWGLMTSNVYGTPPDDKIMVDLESFITKYVETLVNEGVVNYISVVELIHIDNNIEPELYGLIYWQDPISNKISSLYITNKCYKLRKRCKLTGIKAEYEYLILKPELEFPFKFFDAYKNELLSAELIDLTDTDNGSIIPLPFNFVKINLNTENGHLFKIIEKYKFYSRMDIDCNDEYILNSTNILFPLLLMIENIKNETLIYGNKIKL